ncbi:MAG: hypothetical protein K2M37_00305 [Muribaculaceae bacterium]|nr:hypothetical protein [Muribaculaceae bacterium]
MANNSTVSVTFTFKGDLAGLKELCANVERMQQAFEAGLQPAEQLKKSLINFNQVSEAFDAIADSVSSLNSVVEDLTGAFSTQEEAERKLETVMRNTMDATDEEIQKIKDFCAAQQEIGVIGDEVQLAGAQELATYLSMSEALEILIPVMNDMTAQQIGLGASAESTAQIATMLGKVMEGQTKALSRYGYSFTEAQEEVLKTGTEMERAAMLAEVVGASVGGMNEALAQTDAGRAQQLANTIGDVKEQVGQLLTGVAPYISVASNLIIVATNAGRVATSMRALASATLGAHGMFGFIKTSSIAAGLGMNAAGRGAQVLAWGLRAIAAATVVTLVITAIATALDYFIGSASEAKNKADELADANAGLSESEIRARQEAEQETRTMARLQAQMEADIARCKDFTGSKQKEKKVVEELNQRYGETMGYFGTVSDWYKALVANSETYCKQMIIEARTRLLANKIAEEKQIQWDATHNEDGSSKLEMQGGIPYNQLWAGLATQYRNKIVDVANGIVAESKKREQVLMDQLSDAQNELSGINYSVRGSSTRPSGGGGKKGGKNATTSKQEKTALEEIEAQIKANEVAAQTATEAELPLIAARIAKLHEEKKAIEAKVEAVKVKPPQYVPPQISEIKTYEELEKAIQHYDGELKKAQPEEREEINRTIQELKKLREAWDEALNPSTPKKSELAEYIDSLVDATKKKFASEADPLAGLDFSTLTSKYQEVMRVLQGMDGDITAEQRESLEKAAKAYAEHAKKAARSGLSVRQVWGNIKGIAGGISSISEAIEGNGSTWERLSGIIDGTFQTFDGISEILGIIKSITQAQQMMTTATEAQSAATTANAAAEAGAAVSKVAASEAVTTANVTEGASGFFKANSWIPFVGAGIAAAGIAAMLAMMGSLPKFADGGIAYGPTVGLFGEYPGAKNNPEVVAPLNRLRSLIGDNEGGNGGRLTCSVRGDQLQFVLDRTKRKHSRT